MKILAALLLAGALVFGIYRIRQQQKNEKQIPDYLNLRLRPLFSDVDRTVWLWLRQVFPEYEVLVKVPMVRFLSGYPEDLKTLVQIKDVYCTFTVCAPHGRVIGCIDVPGAKGLKASRRDLKQKLFEQCGLPYAVLGHQDLPTHAVLRAVFLKETAPLTPSTSQFEPSHSSQASEFPVTEAPMDIAPTPVVNLDSVGSVRNSLHIKLDDNRKRRHEAMESLKNSTGVVEDKVSSGLVPRWDDSFIMSEGVLPQRH